MNRSQILVVPACEPGRGGGHLSRCMSLVSGLRALEREAWLFAGSLLPNTDFESSWRITEADLSRVRANPVECVVLDRFQTPPEELARWKEIAPVVGIDEGGTDRDSFDFLVDILPNIEKVKPNITNPAFIAKNISRRDAKPLAREFYEQGKSESIKILISFGQEDSAGLGRTVAEALSKENNDDIEITLLRGSLHAPVPCPPSPVPSNIKILETIPNLSEHLAEYDLLITHFGITAFEALYVGVPVILVNPTAYHEKLAKSAGFITVKKPSSSSLVPLCLRVNSLRIICEKLAAKYGLNKESETLPSFVNRLSPLVNKNCPVCGEKKPKKSLARCPDRTYRRCPRCGIIYMDRTGPAPIEYEKEYFFERYKKQYGKTYIEDFPNLIAMAKRRLKKIKRIGGKGALLDIGCAYGPFLAAAREEGLSPIGIDPAQDAVNYVQKELGITAVQGFFPDCQLPATQYDVVTLWYVIEHFRDCVPVFKEIRKILKPGGILAFSTPSFAGVSGKTSLNKFLSKSPGDHFTVWSPRTCKKALAKAGFKVKKIVISGHHPERFPLLGKLAKSKISPLYWLLLAVSKVFKLGDTFEVYAVQEEKKTNRRGRKVRGD